MDIFRLPWGRPGRQPQTTDVRQDMTAADAPTNAVDPVAAAHELAPSRTSLPEARFAELAATDLGTQTEFLAARLRSIGHSHANRLLQRFLGIKVRHYSVLSLAASGVNPSQRELSDFLSLDPSQIVSLVDALEKQGWVERRVDPRDRRSRIVVATEAGQEAFALARQLTGASDDVVLARLTPEERAELGRLLALVAY